MSGKLHAFIVGVSEYPNLLESDAHEETPKHHLGLRRLASAAKAAHRLFEWLHVHADSLRAPLGTCQLLLSPSSKESGANGIALRATMENFEDTANAWRDAVSSDRDNIALFYFAGHGLIRNTSEKSQLLLLEEFGSKPHRVLHGGIEASNLLSGMASRSDQDEMGRTQLYFIDACRSLPEAAASFEDLQGSLIWDIPRPLPESIYTDDRLAPVIYTAEPGARAFGIEGVGSIFGEALLACLDGGAGKYDQANRRWAISLNSLYIALPQQLAIVNKKFGTDQMVRFSDVGPDVLVRTLGGPPLVDLTITVEPEERRAMTAVSVTAPDDRVLIDVAAPFPDEHHDQVHAGGYSVTARGASVTREFMSVQPPATSWLLSV